MREREVMVEAWRGREGESEKGRKGERKRERERGGEREGKGEGLKRNSIIETIMVK